jgi:hypothetical protein
MAPSPRNARGIIGLEALHHVARALQHARHARFADEHVVGFLGQHELRRARQRVEARLGQRAQLEFAVAVGEVGEHEEREPIRRLLVERAEDARIVGVAGASLQQFFRFLPPVATEVAVQQVDHRPQVTAFLDVDLEQVAQVVLRRARESQMTLLLDRTAGSVSPWRHDDPPEVGTVLSGDVLPGRFAQVLAEVDLAFASEGARKMPQR